MRFTAKELISMLVHLLATTAGFNCINCISGRRNERTFKAYQVHGYFSMGSGRRCAVRFQVDHVLARGLGT